jgi:hypothetical protein
VHRLPFNPITLEYHDDNDGMKLMNKDEESKVIDSILINDLRSEDILEQQILMLDPIVVTIS